MPKHTITLTAKEVLEITGDEGDIVDDLIEYAPDNNFPDGVEGDMIRFDSSSYDDKGNLVLIFDHDEPPEDEDEDEEGEE